MRISVQVFFQIYHLRARKAFDLSFAGGAEMIAAANLNLRTVERVMLLLARYRAATFDDLFDEMCIRDSLCTHGHYDHVGSAEALRTEWNAKKEWLIFMITIWVPKRLVEIDLYKVAARSPQALADLSEQSYAQRIDYAAQKVQISGAKIEMCIRDSP